MHHIVTGIQQELKQNKWDKFIVVYNQYDQYVWGTC